MLNSHLFRLKKFLHKIKGKAIHIVGVTGAEGSNVLRFLRKHNISNITAHDFLLENSLEKSFKLWHKGIPVSERGELFQQFIFDLNKINLCTGNNYLKDITSADIIFVPQSWRLYKKQNLLLWQAKKKNIPFYSLTRIYLDFAPAQIIAVTGTAGKGSVANILVQLLKKSLPEIRQVYFAGNETWMLQLADRLDGMSPEDILVLEVSHRQLQDGFSCAPYLVVVTNLYPNHLDEVSWEEYKSLKFSILFTQTPSNVTVLNYDVPELKRIATKIKSKVAFYSGDNKYMNTKNVQKVYETIMNIKSDQYVENLLAAYTALDAMGYDIKALVKNIASLTPLPARLQYLGSKDRVKFYDDIKSTTPWSTLAAARKLGPGLILICGGRTKRVDYQEFALQIVPLSKYIIILKSQLSGALAKILPKDQCQVVSNLQDALESAYKRAKSGENIVVSPAAGFFYSDFIKEKKSIRKLITSLPPKEQV